VNTDTTFGKTVKVLFFVAISGAINALISWLAGNPSLFNPYLTGLINIVLVAGKNFIDPQVRNF